MNWISLNLMRSVGERFRNKTWNHCHYVLMNIFVHHVALYFGFKNKKIHMKYGYFFYSVSHSDSFIFILQKSTSINTLLCHKIGCCMFFFSFMGTFTLVERLQKTVRFCYHLRTKNTPPQTGIPNQALQLPPSSASDIHFFNASSFEASGLWLQVINH